MQCALALLPQEEVQHRFDSYRKRYDPNYKQIPAHIMLRQPFARETESQVDLLVAPLQKVAEQARPFSICLRTVRLQPRSRNLYFTIEDREPILQLHQHIQTALTPFVEPQEHFIPRLPISHHLDEEELHDLYATMRLDQFAWYSPIDAFHLMTLQPDQAWSIRHSFLLGSDHPTGQR